MSILKMTDLDLAGKRVLIREDLNVPIKDGKVLDDKEFAKLPQDEQDSIEASIQQLTDELLYHGDINAALRRMMQEGVR